MIGAWLWYAVAAAPVRCGDSYYTLGVHLPTRSSRFVNHALVPNADNAVDTILRLKHGDDTIGYIYVTGDGTRYVSGRPLKYTAERQRLLAFYATVAPKKQVNVIAKNVYAAGVRFNPKFAVKSPYRGEACVSSVNNGIGI